MKQAKVMSLGTAQDAAESAARALTLAQTAFIRAKKALKDAEALHATAMEALHNEMDTVTTRCKSVPLVLR